MYIIFKFVFRIFLLGMPNCLKDMYLTYLIFRYCEIYTHYQLNETLTYFVKKRCAMQWYLKHRHSRITNEYIFQE